MNRHPAAMVAALALIALACVKPEPQGRPAPPPDAPRVLAFGSPAFKQLVDDSYLAVGRGSSADFFSWWDNEMRAQGYPGAKTWIAFGQKRLTDSADPSRTKNELGEELHKIVKKTIRKFNLDRGFEFANVVTLGERQCLLQSVLIASMLQAVGVDCGIAMVWSNEKDEKSNLGHVAVYLPLDPKTAVLVDASEPYPHPKHRGIFLWNTDRSTYEFVRPDYAPDATFKTLKTPKGDDRKPSQFTFLNAAYTRSQFDFYRGERTPQGLIAKDKNPAGLAKSAEFLQRSVQECPQNPLSQFSVARVLLLQGKKAEAKQALDHAKELYQEYGWVPPGVEEVSKSLK
jgi:hypothetical protein